MIPLPDGPFSVIYADPPWSYENKKTGGSMSSGASQKYDTLPLEAIKGIINGVPTTRDAVLFMWVTVPLLPEAFEVLNGTRFHYKTMLSWRKIMSMGTGFWFRGQMEHLILGVKGNVKAFRLQEPNFFQSQVQEHSRKPDYYYGLIERATANMPHVTRIELFARRRRAGWASWGNQLSEEEPLLQTTIQELI